MLIAFLIQLWVLVLIPVTFAQQDATCDAHRPCKVGCCSKYNSCGFGPDFCGDGCQSNCDAKAECGKYGVQTLCPLNVCCSKYGFCGTTADFCGDGCQNGCATIDRPTCSANSDAMTYKRRIGYYELFGVNRPCDVMEPEGIAAAGLTHINLAFELIGADNKITDTQGGLVARVARLKKIHQALRVNIAVGGWNFNDPPTDQRFTNMASTSANRQTFIRSVIAFLQKYGLDGIDIDWEYPVAPDRGGHQADYDNYPLLISEMRTAFDKINPGWEITITLPSSYWYMRGFNLQALQNSVSFFNFMSYDLHGMWDYDNKYTGPYLLGHTNVTEVDLGLDLLWRNRIKPENVVFGLAFYGRSFTMKDAQCSTPNGVCEFSAAGSAGDCSQTPGILIYAEIESSNGTLNSDTYYIAKDTVKYNTYGFSQWISYDDEESFHDKKNFLSGRCLSGLMIWAIDQDTSQYDAITALLGDGATNGVLQQAGPLDEPEKEHLAHDLGAYTGQDCYVTLKCAAPGDPPKPDAVCRAGFTSVAIAHDPYQIQPGQEYKLHGGACPTGSYRKICCPKDALPKNCQWTTGSSDLPVPKGVTTCFDSKCGDNQFQLAEDLYSDQNALGHSLCYPLHSTRKLCCDSTEILNQCFWTGCQGPFDDKYNFQAPPLDCPAGSKYMTYRYDAELDPQSFCAYNYLFKYSDVLQHKYAFARAYCCPNDDLPRNCSWSNQPNYAQNSGVVQPFDPYSWCHPTHCPAGLVEYTSAKIPPNSSSILGISGSPMSIQDCVAESNPPGTSVFFPYCCNPPQDYGSKYPVPPPYLWANYYDAPADDVTFAYVDNYGNNNMDSKPNPDSYGDDPYGFIMLDGPDGSLNGQFAQDFTFVHEAHENIKVKRSLLTTDPSRLDAVFDHKEETAYVFCKHELGDPRCGKIFHKGAKDTIIRLPDHVGEGPFARVVSMEYAEDNYLLPKHHTRQRALEKNYNPVYKLTYDYSFHLIQSDSQVNIRVDYTNLASYWDMVTDTPASKLKKRKVRDHDFSQAEWKNMVRRAKAEHIRKRDEKRRADAAKEHMGRAITKLGRAHSYVPTKLGKRWFGKFVDWLKRLNNVDKSSVGFLNMIWRKSTLLYHASIGCPSATAFAELSITMDSNVNLEATYAYYFSGTIVPPAVTGTFAYFSLEPSAYLGLRVDGFAQMQYQSRRLKLINTITYPGLAIKGIAAVGPTLDVYGQIKGIVTLSGTMQVGFRFNYQKQEWFWPDDDESDSYKALLGLEGPPDRVQNGITPEFYGSVQAEAGLDIIVTPEANMGIKVGGDGKIPTLFNAQIVGYFNNTLRFNAHAQAFGGSGGSGYSYGYSIKYLYNIGYGAVANSPFFPWFAKRHDLFNPPKEIPIYAPPPIHSTPVSRKRGLSLPSRSLGSVPRRGLLNSLTDNGLSVPVGLLEPHPPLRPRMARREILSSNGGMNNFSAASNFSMQKRDTGPQPDFSVGQLFRCPPVEGCTCFGAQCNSKRDISNTDIAPRAPATPCDPILPDLRLNCRVFHSELVQGIAPVTGICDNEKNFFVAQNIVSPTGFVMTYDGGDEDAVARAGQRRLRPCPKSACQNDNMQFTNALGLAPATGGYLSCDEFPPASTEQGGNWYDQIPSSQGVAIGPVGECTPVWQQSLQGNCNKLLGSLSTNLAWSGYSGDPQADPVWIPWAGPEKNWLTAHYNTIHGQVFNRLTLYPEQVPLSPGIDENAWENSGRKLSWNFKRNFTYGLSSPQNAGSGDAWSENAKNRLLSWSYEPSDGNTYTDATQVVCAVNLFGQENLYSYEYNGNFNAYCIVSNPPPPKNPNPFNQPFGFVPVTMACRVRWATNASGLKKRGIGSFGPHEIESIEIDEDAPVLGEVPPEVMENLGEQLPYKWVKSSKQV